jgi:two-component system LytT family response regulator
MTIALCDDDERALRELKAHVSAFFDDKKISATYGLFDDGESVVKDKTPYDLAFIDIELPGINGLTVAKLLKEYNPNVIVFMVTSFQSYLDDAMGIQVFRYLTKPIDRNRLYRNMGLALQQYFQQKNTILLDEADGSHLIFTQEILYICIHGRGSLFKTKTGEYESHCSLVEWSERLNSDLFCQPHYSYIVNLQNVHDVTKTDVILRDGTGKPLTVIVSRRKYATFKNAFFKYVGGVK